MVKDRLVMEKVRVKSNYSNIFHQIDFLSPLLKELGKTFVGLEEVVELVWYS